MADVRNQPFTGTLSDRTLEQLDAIPMLGSEMFD
jgi:hypothetical protein